MFRVLSLLILIVSMGLGSIVNVTASDQDDIAAARERAEEIFELAANHDFNTMYDYIHPDAHEIVPRVIAVRVFEELYSYYNAGGSEINDVELISWKWGVTGKEYPYAAAVRFTQPYVEDGTEKSFEDTMYLVQDENGEWRWFLGATADFVKAAIESFGEDVSIADPEELTTGNVAPLVDGDLPSSASNIFNDLDSFYKGAFEYTDLDYVTPDAVLVENGTSRQTECGPAKTGFWAFYCPLDGTLYLDEAFLAELNEASPYAVAFVIAHEFAHHIQTVIGLDRVAGEQPDEWNEVHSVELELMADCMSGAWSLDVGSRGMLRANDIRETMDFTIKYLGDPEQIDVYDPQAHGTAEMRVESFMGGYENGFVACNIVI